MDSLQNTHHHILLSKNQSGRIAFCETCDMVELTLGPISVRVNAQDLSLLCELVQVAQTKLSYYRSDKARLDNELFVTEVH